MSPSDPMRKIMLEAGAMDTDHPDSAPPRRLNELIWKSVKGVNSEMPAPRHALGSSEKDD